jgi:hypothetical protein
VDYSLALAADRGTPSIPDHLILFAGSRFDDHVNVDPGQRILRTTSTGASPESCHWSHTLSVISLRSSHQFDPTVPWYIV